MVTITVNCKDAVEARTLYEKVSSFAKNLNCYGSELAVVKNDGVMNNQFLIAVVNGPFCDAHYEVNSDDITEIGEEDY